jgi:hypothetical protein
MCGRVRHPGDNFERVSGCLLALWIDGMQADLPGFHIVARLRECSQKFLDRFVTERRVLLHGRQNRLLKRLRERGIELARRDQRVLLLLRLKRLHGRVRKGTMAGEHLVRNTAERVLITGSALDTKRLFRGLIRRISQAADIQMDRIVGKRGKGKISKLNLVLILK